MIRALGSGIDIFLQPGEWYFGDEDTRIRTTLGSCVAFTLWHPERLIGGMCHYMLPTRGMPGFDAQSGRYGDEALALLLREAKRLGTRPQEYEVKLFGGANMFPGLARSEAGVPTKNIAKARQLLLEHGLRAKAESLGGTRFRQLIFTLANGEVWVRTGQASDLASGTSSG